MAATVIVELTGDERRVLEAYRKTEEADKKLRDATAQTGDSAKAASKDFADAWVNAGKGSAIGIAALMKQLRLSGDEGAAAAKRLTTEMQRSGVDSSTAFQAVIDKLKETDPAAAAAAERIRVEMADAAEAAKQSLIEADRATEFKQTIESLKKLGPEGAEVAKGIQQKMEQASAAAAGSMDEIIAKLGQLEPAAAAAAAQIKIEMASAAAAAKQELAEAEKASQFKQTIDALRKLGPEGAKVAAGIQKDLDRAAAATVGSMDQIIAKIAQIEPAAAAAAAKIKVEMAEADAATVFDNSIAQLKKINPEAAKAAEAIREKMDLADAGVKFDNIIEELRKIDPVAAQEAAKMRAHMRTAADDSTNSWKMFAASSVTQIASVAGAYMGVQEAIQLVNQYLKDQEEILKRSLDKQISLAKVQQEAAKNLAAYKAVERDELLQTAVPEIARASGVGDVAAITTALGSAASAGATPEEAKAAVMAAARVNQLTSDKIDEATGAAVSIMKQTGLKDPREAISLLQTAGPLSKIDDAAQVAEVLPRALGTVQTVPNQDAGEASKQIASFFAAATNIGVDEQGTSSATFTIDFMNRMNGLFTDLENKQIDARSKIELIDRKIEKGTATEANIRDKGQLQAFLDQSANVVDPGTVFGRLQILQQNQGMQQQFLGDTGKFGEQQFQVFLKGILDANSEATRSVINGASQIQASAQYFEDTASSSARSTPQVVLAGAAQSAAAAIETNQSFNNEAAALGFVRQVTATALSETRRTGAAGFGDSMGETGISRGMLAGATAIEEAGSAIVALRERAALLGQGGLTQQESGQVEILKATEKSIRDAITGLIETGGIDREAAAASLQFLEAESRRVDSPLAGPAAQGSDEAAKAILELVATIRESMNKPDAPVQSAVPPDTATVPEASPQPRPADVAITPPEPAAPMPATAEVPQATPQTTAGDATIVAPAATPEMRVPTLQDLQTAKQRYIDLTGSEDIVPNMSIEQDAAYQEWSRIGKAAWKQTPTKMPTPLDTSNQPVAPIGDPNAPQPEGSRQRVTRNGVAVTEDTYAPDPAIAERQLVANEKTAAAIEAQNRLIEEQNALLAETADNTRPVAGAPPNYDAIYNTSTEEADAR